MRILGIDPGLRVVGWGVIRVEGGRIGHVANGQLRPAGEALPERLRSLHEGLSELFARWAPQAAAVEAEVIADVNAEEDLR